MKVQIEISRRWQQYINISYRGIGRYTNKDYFVTKDNEMRLIRFDKLLFLKAYLTYVDCRYM